MLNDDQRAAMLDKVSKDFGPETPSDILSVDATSDGSVQEIKVEDVKPVKSTDPKVEETVEVDKTEKVEVGDDSPQPRGHKVPYSRFKNVLESRNNFRNEVATYKDKLTNLEKKLANLQQSQERVPQKSVQQPEQQKTWLDEYLDTGNQDSTPEWKSDFSSLNDRLYKFEVAQEEQALKAELAVISDKFPNVPHNVLLKAVIDDPNANMTVIAEQYGSFMAGIEEQAIARYLESQGGDAPQQTAPEPLQRPRSTNAPRGKVAPDKKPTSVSDASGMLRDLLKKNNFLKK